MPENTQKMADEIDRQISEADKQNGCGPTLGTITRIIQSEMQKLSDRIDALESSKSKVGESGPEVFAPSVEAITADTKTMKTPKSKLSIKIFIAESDENQKATMDSQIELSSFPKAIEWLSFMEKQHQIWFQGKRAHELYPIPPESEDDLDA